MSFVFLYIESVDIGNLSTLLSVLLQVSHALLYACGLGSVIFMSTLNGSHVFNYYLTLYWYGVYNYIAITFENILTYSHSCSVSYYNTYNGITIKGVMADVFPNLSRYTISAKNNSRPLAIFWPNLTEQKFVLANLLDMYIFNGKQLLIFH